MLQVWRDSSKEQKAFKALMWPHLDRFEVESIDTKNGLVRIILATNHGQRLGINVEQDRVEEMETLAHLLLDAMNVYRDEIMREVDEDRENEQYMDLLDEVEEVRRQESNAYIEAKKEAALRDVYGEFDL